MREQFTPGPWKKMYSTDTKGVCCLAVWPSKTNEGTIGSPICKISPEQSENKEDEANAVLIAAAPEMYKAIKRTIEAVGPDHDLDDRYVTIMKADFLKLKAAFSKANPQCNIE
jgi:hypothetical protein